MDPKMNNQQFAPKMLFVLPPSTEGGHRFHPSHHPITTATLAGVARENGAQVIVVDPAVSGRTRQDVVAEILRLEPDWVGMVSYEYRREVPLTHSKTFAQELREKGIKAPVGMLSCPVGDLECRKLVEKRDLDFLVFGDAECVVQAFAQGKGFIGKGILANTDQGMVEEEPVEKLDWSILVPPAWDLMDWRHYIPSAHRYRKLPVFPVMASRSCPFGCDFCPQSLFQPSDVYSSRPVADIISEIVHLQEEYSAHFIEFYDPTFGVNREEALELIKAIGALKTPIAWSCYSRSDLLDRELLQEMSKSGCHSILFGVESGNEDVLARTQKGLDLGEVKRMVKECREFKISTIASFIIGLPLDTPETLKETIQFAVKLNPTYAQFHQARAFFAHKDWADLGQVDQNWKEMASSINGQAYLPNGMTQDDIQKILLRAYLRFYGSPKKMVELSRDLRTLDDLRRYVRGLKQLGSYFRGMS
jgi:anaerobic magnesium-protoporphyrin IX monomethyl ester cyclase